MYKDHSKKSRRNGILILWICLAAAILFSGGCSTEIGVRKVAESERRLYGVADFSAGTLNGSTVNLLSNYQLTDLYQNRPDSLISCLEMLYLKNKEKEIVAALADTSLQIGYRFRKERDLSGRYFLAAALYSCFYLKYLDNAKELYDEQRIRQIRIYNLANTELFCYLKERQLERKRNFELAMPGNSKTVLFAAPSFELPLPEKEIRDFTVCANYKTKNLTHDTRIFGLGVPLVAQLYDASRDPRTRIALPGIPLGVTLVTDFEYDQAADRFRGRLRYVYSRTVQRIRLGKYEIPLASDFSTPLAKASEMPDKMNFLRRTLKVEEASSLSGLYLFEPYDDKRIPVVFVHGLMSDMRTWGQMLNTLLHDPVIRTRYQFLGFAYSSGNPIFLSAGMLRDELAALRKRLLEQNCSVETFDKMVLVGHSMGGLLSRLQITSCTPEKTAEIFGLKNTEAIKSKFTAVELDKARKTLLFQPGSFIKRVIFIAVPHRGSEIARSWIGTIGSFMIDLPLDLVRFNVKVFDEFVKTGKIRIDFSANTGIDNLRPDSPALKLLNELPIPEGIPCHSIIGNNEKGFTPGGTDGVVPYWSSHLDHSSSELIVHSGHSAHRVPLAIQEVRRILLMHVKKSSSETKSGNRVADHKACMCGNIQLHWLRNVSTGQNESDLK